MSLILKINFPYSRAMGFRPSPEELAELIEEIDEDGSGAIEFPEFAQERLSPTGLRACLSIVLGLPNIHGVCHRIQHFSASWSSLGASRQALTSSKWLKDIRKRAKP